MDMEYYRVEEIPDIAASVMAVENLLRYQFKQKNLLEEALTHPSCTDSVSVSYQRLEFVGDAALGLAVSNYIFLKYPDLDPGKLTLLRSANISTEKLARVAVRHRLYEYVRRNVTALDEKFAVDERKRNPADFALWKAAKPGEPQFLFVLIFVWAHDLKMLLQVAWKKNSSQE